MADTFDVHAVAQPYRAQEGGASVLDDSSSNPLQDVLPGPQLEDDALDTGAMEEQGEERARRTTPYDHNLRPISGRHAFGHRTNVRYLNFDPHIVQPWPDGWSGWLRVTSLEEVVAELIADGSTIAMEGISHLIPRQRAPSS